ncbi:MAG: hypothetical protein SPG61_00180, partial [Arcanobacterium sp.]|nr:hypothetical protein [Arcanobacterium sp.]
MDSQITITALASRDIEKFIKFTMIGMNFSQLMPNKFLAYEYARYFVHEVLQGATHVYAAYEGEEFLGALVFDAGRGARPYRKYIRGVYTKLAGIIERKLFAKTAGAYHRVNEQLLEKAGGK